MLELINVSGSFSINQLATVGNVFVLREAELLNSDGRNMKQQNVHEINVEKTPNKQHRPCRKCRDPCTHNKELAVDVLIDSPPAAGAEGFVENIEKPRELGCRYLTKRYDSTRCRLRLAPCFRCSKDQLRLLLSRAGRKKETKQSSKGIRNYS